MSVETLGDAYEAAWRVIVRCAWGPRDGMKRVRECVYGGEFDFATLVGQGFSTGEAGEQPVMPALRVAKSAAGVQCAADGAASSGFLCPIIDRQRFSSILSSPWDRIWRPEWLGCVMPEYRFYKISPDGHIAEPPPVIECDDDLSAIQEARKRMDGHDIEICQGDRVVTYLVPESFSTDTKR